MIRYLLLISLVICTSTDKPIGPFPNVINGKFHDLARPYLADVNVDCHIKMAAYDFAKKIQPERGEHRAVFDALQLQQCNMERPGEDKPLEIPDIEDPGFSVFVDIHQGDDQNSGSIRDPVKTIERGIALTRGVEGKKTVFLREGEYYLPKPLLLTKVDDDLTISGYGSGDDLEVHIGGPQAQLDSLELGDLSVSIDLKSCTKAGEYEVPVTITLPSDASDCSVETSVTVKVTLEQRTTAADNNSNSAEEDTDNESSGG